MMRDKLYNPRKQTPRLSGWNYSTPGAYFVTICTYGKEYLLGEIIDSTMHLSVAGEIVRYCWNDLPQHYINVCLDAFVVMPNHIHGILVLKGTTEYKMKSKCHGLSEIVRGFKTYSSKRINAERAVKGVKFWQRGFYDHIIRNDVDLSAIREYIVHNPSGWSKDEEHPSQLGM